MGYCRQILIYILILSFYVPSESSSCAPCSEGMFQCSYTCKCISASSRCNGVHNCLFNDDEDNCYTKPPLPACDFTCELTGMCLESSSRCDGINDCFDDSDEKNCAFCKSGNFLCNNSRCIRSKYVCDGDNDCDDNSDEMFCSHKETTTEISASEACYCLNQVQCYSVYESCTDGCFDGYYGDKCDNKGSGNCHCLEKWECETDSCTSCDHWWKGYRCSYRDKEQCHCTDKTECFSAYSYFSLITCSSCEEGYTGPRCNDKVKKLSEGILVVVIVVSLFGGIFLICGCYAAIVKARRRKNQCRETRNQTRQNSPRSCIIFRNGNNTNPLRNGVNQRPIDAETVTHSSTNGSTGDSNESNTSEEQNTNVRLSVIHGLVLLARGLQQSRDEESRRHQEFDLPPSYESVATIPLTQPALYPDEPPPSYDSISFQSTSCIRQTQGAVNNGFLSDI